MQLTTQKRIANTFPGSWHHATTKNKLRAIQWAVLASIPLILSDGFCSVDLALLIILYRQDFRYYPANLSFLRYVRVTIGWVFSELIIHLIEWIPIQSFASYSFFVGSFIVYSHIDFYKEVEHLPSQYKVIAIVVLLCDIWSLTFLILFHLRLPFTVYRWFGFPILFIIIFYLHFSCVAVK